MLSIFVCSQVFRVGWPGDERKYRVYDKEHLIREGDIDLVFLVEIISRKSLDELERNGMGIPTEEI